MRKGKYQIYRAALLLLMLTGCAAAPPVFDGERAMHDLVAQCDFGPRPPGTAAHDSCGRFLIDRLRETADTVIRQDFVHIDSLTGHRIEMFNIIARFGEGERRRILCAHWDTRPFADLDPDSTRRNEPIIGANDGASGVAVLLEIARLFGQRRPPTAVDIVLFDGEDYGPQGRLDLYLLGSKYFSKHVDPELYEFAILLDMVGDADLRIGPEVFSARFAPKLVERVWSVAERLGVTEFDRSAKYSIYDDHIPLLQKGIPTIDLIDFDYPFWHTTADTPDKCSAASLTKVGQVVTVVIYEK